MIARRIFSRGLRRASHGVDRMGCTEDLFPASDPAFVEIPSFVSWIGQDNGRMSGAFGSRAEKRPGWPMRSIKPGDQHILKLPLTCAHIFERRGDRPPGWK